MGDVTVRLATWLSKIGNFGYRLDSGHGIRKHRKMDIKIDRVGLPKARVKYPFSQMKVGDSILVEGDYKTMVRARVAAYAYGKYYGKAFQVRMEGYGLRIYLVDDDTDRKLPEA